MKVTHRVFPEIDFQQSPQLECEQKLKRNAMESSE